MNPIRLLADQALFQACGRVPAGPNVWLHFHNALVAAVNGDKVILRAALSAIADAGYTPEDFDGLDGFGNLQDAVTKARTQLRQP